VRATLVAHGLELGSARVEVGLTFPDDVDPGRHIPDDEYPERDFPDGVKILTVGEALVPYKCSR
jgi:hypothetical protein